MKNRRILSSPTGYESQLSDEQTDKNKQKAISQTPTANLKCPPRRWRVAWVTLVMVTNFWLGMAHASIFYVTNLMDSGAGSLREAISLAEANSDADQINFELGGMLGVSSVFSTITTEISIASNGFDVTLDGTGTGDRAFVISSGGDLTLSTFTFQNFSTSGAKSGGAISVEGGVLRVNDSTFTGNTSDRTGGAIRINGGGSANIQTSTFTGNEALQGGAISLSTGSLTLSDSGITNNTAVLTSLSTSTGQGGGISGFNAQITINNSDISNNTAEGSTGGVFIKSGTLAIDNSTINQNDAQGTNYDAGGILVAGGAEATITDSEIRDNTVADGYGGGIFSQDAGTSVTVERTTIDGNTAKGGGGIRSADADVTIIESTISNNEATVGGGGGVSAYLGHTVTLTNSTISGNTSATGGGGVVIYSGVSGEIVDSTIAFNTNSSGVGAGLEFTTQDGSTFMIENSIFSDNLANGAVSTVAGPVDSLGFNLFDNDPMLGNSSDLVDAEADLQPLADNGGPTLTHALGANSDAIDAGMTDLPTDQRGYYRPAGIASDIGAYEYGAVPEPSVAFLVGLAAIFGLIASRRRRSPASVQPGA